MPRGPASVVEHRRDSVVDGTRPQAWPLRLEECGRGQVEAKEDSEEDEMDLHSSTSKVKLTLKSKFMTYIWKYLSHRSMTVR